MIHNLRRPLGVTPAGSIDCSAWGGIKSYFDWTLSNSDYAANAYQCAQYGTIPQLTDVTPGPGPAAPQTKTQMTTAGAWTPEQAATQGSADYTARIKATIQNAQDTGAYNPAGNLPTATWFDAYKWEIITAASALGLLILWKARP